MITKQRLIGSLKQVLDLELGLDIVDLGLICNVQVDIGAAGVTMMLTSPACPLHTAIARGV